MIDKFEYKEFSQIDINDSIFSELRYDYNGNNESIEFNAWFKRKASENAKALVFNDSEGLGAFIYLKEEKEEVITDSAILPLKERIKIGSFKIAKRYRGKRLGEGAIGLVLWKWQKKSIDDIYNSFFKA